MRVLTRSETSVEQIQAVAQTVAGCPCRIHVAGEHAAACELLEVAIGEHSTGVATLLLRLLRDGEALVRDLIILDAPQGRGSMVGDTDGEVLVADGLPVYGIHFAGRLVGSVQRGLLVIQTLIVYRIDLAGRMVRSGKDHVLVVKLLGVDGVDLAAGLVGRVKLRGTFGVVDRPDVAFRLVGLAGSLVRRVKSGLAFGLVRGFDVLLGILGLARRLIVGIELRCALSLIDRINVFLRIIGLRLGLGIVNVKLRLVIVGGHPDIVDGSLDAIGTQPPTVGQGVSGLFAHARGFGLTNDRVTSILQHTVRTLDLAAAETGALTLLKNLLRSILGTTGNVLQSLLGLRALLGKTVKQIAGLVEDDAVVLACF